MPQEGSCLAMPAKVSAAFLYQKECSKATARLNCGWSAGSQEIGNSTLPSFSGSPAACSCWPTAGIANIIHAQMAARDTPPAVLILPPVLPTFGKNKDGPLLGCAPGKSN